MRPPFFFCLPVPVQKEESGKECSHIRAGDMGRQGTGAHIHRNGVPADVSLTNVHSMILSLRCEVNALSVCNRTQESSHPAAAASSVTA